MTEINVPFMFLTTSVSSLLYRIFIPFTLGIKWHTRLVNYVTYVCI